MCFTEGKKCEGMGKVEEGRVAGVAPLEASNKEIPFVQHQIRTAHRRREEQRQP